MEAGWRATNFSPDGLGTVKSQDTRVKVSGRLFCPLIPI
jgi:hypothetical protein